VIWRILVLTIMLLMPASVLADGCILLENGLDFLLLENGVDKILLESSAACGGAPAAANPTRTLMGVGQ
jgi:hypothetical protein